MQLTSAEWVRFAQVAFRHLHGTVSKEMVEALQSQGNKALEFVGDLRSANCPPNTAENENEV